jgi:hypothetical protein
MRLNTFAVGEKVSDEWFGHNYNQTKIFLTLGPGGFSMPILIPALTEEEIQAIRRGSMRYKIAVRRKSIFFCVKFGDDNWMDMPFDARLERQHYEHQELPENQGLGVMVILVDSKTQVCHAARLVGLHHKTSVELQKMIEDQLKSDFDHDANIQQVYQTESSSKIANSTQVGGRIG